MPWMYPACGSIVRHSEIEERPRPGARYRCHICRLELVMDAARKKLIVPAFDQAADEKPNNKKPKA
jgi:hypothetical protein